MSAARAPAKLVFVLGRARRSGSDHDRHARSAWHLAEARQRPRACCSISIFTTGDAALQLDVKPTTRCARRSNIPSASTISSSSAASSDVSNRASTCSPRSSRSTKTVEYQRGGGLSLAVEPAAPLPLCLRRSAGLGAAVLHASCTCPACACWSATRAWFRRATSARWREKSAPTDPRRSTLHILNKSGRPGSLPLAEFVRAAGQEPTSSSLTTAKSGSPPGSASRASTNCAAFIAGSGRRCCATSPANPSKPEPLAVPRLLADDDVRIRKKRPKAKCNARPTLALALPKLPQARPERRQASFTARARTTDSSATRFSCASSRRSPCA